MKWFWSHCRRQRATSLLAADALTGNERLDAERHLAECAHCRAQYHNLKEIAAPLVQWEKDFSSLEVTPVMRGRWAAAVLQQSTRLEDVSRSSTLDAGIVRTFWRQLIWPSRFTWSGLAALWLVMLVVNGQFSEHGAGGLSSSPQQVLQSWKEQNRVLAEWDRPSLNLPASPARAARPRSQKEQDWVAI